MDVQMPQMDGLATTREMRKRGHDVPVVFLTASVFKEDRDRCFAAGGNDYLMKPVRLDDLRNAVRRNGLRGSASTASTSDVNAGVIEQLLAHFQNDRDFLREMSGLFATHHSASLGQLRAALSDGDLERVASEAHSLKGSLSVFGVESATGAALAVERAAREGDASTIDALVCHLEQQCDHVASLLRAVEQSSRES